MHTTTPSTYLMHWLVASLRWLILLGLTISLAIRAPISLLLILLLFAAALWNLFLTLLALINRGIYGHRVISVAGDMILAYLVFFLSGGLSGSLVWAGLLPVVTASLYFNLRGGLVAALVGVILQGVFTLLMAEPLSALVLITILIPLYLGAAYLFSRLNEPIAHTVERTQKTEQTNRKESERLEIERKRSLYNLVSNLSSSLNYQRVLDTALDLTCTALSTADSPADQIYAAVMLFTASEKEGGELRIGPARRFAPADLRVTLPGTTGVIGKAIDEGEPKLTKEPAKDPELGRVIALRSCNSAYCLPLRTGLDAFGVIVFAHEDTDFFNTERRELLDIVGNQINIAIQNARLYENLEQEKERMMEIQDEARKKMARDLHDGPTQTVSAIAMRVNFARRLLDRDPKAAADELYKIEELARRTTKEIRHMLFTLRPLVLESQGLIAALNSMSEKMREVYNQTVIIQADPDVVANLETNKQAVVFYIAEEAVNNARKHARAAHIWVRIREPKDDLCLLEIEDDGVGFNVASVDASYENRGSLGMVNMRERTELVNGILQVDSTEGRGTRVRVLIPLTEEASDRMRRGQ